MGIESIFTGYNEREMKKLEKLADKVLALDSKMTSLSDEELRAKTDEFKNRLKNGETLDDIMVEAYAVLREGAYRAIGKKHYKVQIIGGIVLHQGRIAEMKTGEGKTLVATLPAYLNALEGKGVHVITVNDYLADRDREQMGRVHGFLGLTTGVILQNMTPEERRDAYNCDITYGTNSEFGFDYLRDNMVMSLEEKVQRGLHYCVIDEVDSILIDEARTPLIISGPGAMVSDIYKVTDYFAKSLKKDVDFTIDHKAKAVLLKDSGVDKAEKYFKVDNFTDLENLSLQHHTIQALKANYIMKKEVDYIVKEGKIFIVDEFTGRIMDGRRFSDGLHEAIEAKEGVKIEGQNKTMATITYQNFFRMYKRLSGMTGTAKTEEEEFREIYNLDVVVVPTNKPIARIDNKDLIFKTEYEKFKAVVKEIEETYKTGQPILVGTTSIEKSEVLSFMLKRKGIPHQVLNAKHHDKEAAIVARAGQKGMVTIATNMAGRGTDIILGEGVADLGGLKVIGTEKHESRRIDNQLRGRAGRQGDVGVSKFYVSFEDELIKVHTSKKFKAIAEKFELKEGEAITDALAVKAIENAQRNIEGNNFDTRKMLIKYDDVTNKQRELIYKQRDQVLSGEALKEQLLAMAWEVIKKAVDEHLDDSIEEAELYKEGLEKLTKYLEEIFAFTVNIDMEQLETLSSVELKDYFYTLCENRYDELANRFGDEIATIERRVLLQVVDRNWVDHIERMEHLKQYIGLRAYKQQDPVQAYQLEGGELFNEMIENIRKDAVRYLFNLK